MPGVYKRGDVWYAVLEMPPENGKRKQRWIAMPEVNSKSKKKAEERRAELITDRNRGELVSDSPVIVGDFVRRYLEDAKPDIAPNTYYNYVSKCERYIQPHFTKITLAKLTAGHVQAFYTKLRTEPSKATGKPLHTNTVRIIHAIMHSALRVAVRWGLIRANPADSVEKPKQVRSKVEVLDKQQTAVLIDAVKGTEFYMPILLAYGIGMRRGEILALRWANIDMDNRIVYVRENLQRVKGERRVVEPKTSHSTRAIVMPPHVVAALRRHKLEQDKRRLSLGMGWKDNGLVCGDGYGEYRIPSTFTDHLTRYLSQASHSKIKLHSLRHGFATALLAKGTSQKVVSQMLGHASAAFTGDVYQHVQIEHMEEVAQVMNGILEQMSLKRKR